MKRLVLLIALAAPLTAQTRIASDFEISQMRQQLSRSGDFLAQLSGRLNLGDAYLSRNEPATARVELVHARNLAARERISARVQSDLTRYATATAYAGLTEAKLGRSGEAFDLLEEAIRYAADSAKTWNIYSSAMSVIRQPAKAASAARNAVSITTRELAASADVSTRLDLAVYQYTLASALIESGDTNEAERLLVAASESLRSSAFAALRRNAAEHESFEIYSTARGNEAAYLSILNRSQLRLAALLEKRGDHAGARHQYANVLLTRTDDATALAGLARLGSEDQREQYYAAAFEANPFALSLVREYQRHLAQSTPRSIDGKSTGARVRQALAHMARGQTRAARSALDLLITEHPNNETLRTLRRESDASARGPAELADLLRLIAGDRLTPEQRTGLDPRVFTHTVTFNAAQTSTDQTVLESGSIDGLPFRFSEPIAFRGTFAANTPLRLTFRVLGATDVDGADGLLVEPLGLEPLP